MSSASMRDAVAAADLYIAERRKFAPRCSHETFETDGWCSWCKEHYDPLYDMSRPATEEQSCEEQK